ncbi:MAG: heme exporter protein CcmB [Candidatus Odinarchaeota archaeon]
MAIIIDALYLAKKDLVLEFRKKETLFSMGLFSFAAVLILSLLINIINSIPDITLVNKFSISNSISAASLWFIITFTVMLGLTSVFSREMKRSSIYSLLSLSIKPQAIFLGKILYLGVILAIIEILTIILAFVFLRMDIQGDTLFFILILTCGTFDLAVAGCIVSFLTIYAKSKTLAIPILFFPLILPSILIATQTTISLVQDYEPMAIITNALLLVIHSIIIITFALLIIDELLSE